MEIRVRINEHREKADGTCAVRLDIHHHGRARHPLGISVASGMWDRKRERVKIGHPRHDLYNDAIRKAVERAMVEVTFMDAKLVK